MKMSNIKLVCNMTPDLEFYGNHLITHKRFPMNDGMKGDANWKSMKKASDEIHRVLQNLRKENVSKLTICLVLDTIAAFASICVISNPS